MSKRQRIPFCGVIEGEVTLLPGETERQAIERASRAIQSVLDRGARVYGRRELDGKGAGPSIGLEPV